MNEVPMIRVRLYLVPAAGLAANLVFAPLALAQAAPTTSTPAQTQEAQQVRDELTKLKQDFDVLRQQYDDRLTKLEERLKEIGGTSGPAAVTAQESGAAPATPPPAATTASQAPSSSPASPSPVPADLP